MKILCTADLHINDWMEYSTLDKYRRPSRLLNYLKLGDEMCSLCLSQGVEAVVLAGDISEASVQRPRVHDVIGDFLRKFSSINVPVYLIHGQHDCDSKEEASMEQNSILMEICKDLKDYGVHYQASPGVVRIRDYDFYFQGWNYGHTLPEDIKADVFVGHGMVKGCTNLDGYVFVNGFDQDELLDRFRFSIIGDIHKHQVFWSKDGNRAVLQPGAPLQNSWKDHEDCGLWVADLQKTHVDLDFYNIHDLAPNEFHKFTYDEEPTELVHSRPRIKNKSKKKKEKKIEVKRDLSLIRDTCLSLTSSDPKLKPLIEEVFENTTLSSSSSIANARILSLTAKNFLSVHTFELDFDEFPDSCVVVGKNGHGKSTISEALYWCLTGKTTKGTPTSELINTYTKEDSCTVTLKIEINGQILTIVRSRQGKSGKLSLLHGDGSVLKGSSMSETQKEIYSLLGLKEWQVFMFSYFCAEDAPLFSDLGESSKNDLISQIVGLDFVESMREYSKSKRVEIRSLKSKTSGVLEEKESRITSSKRKLEELVDEAEKLRPQIERKIKRCQEGLEELLEDYEEVSTSIPSLYSKVKVEDIEGLNDLIGKVAKKYHSLQGQVESSGKTRRLLESEIRRIETDLNKAEKGDCPTCGQPTQDDNLLKKLRNSKRNKLLDLEDLPNEEETSEKADILGGKLEKLEKLRKTIQKKTQQAASVNEEIESVKKEISNLHKSLEAEVDSSLISHLETELKELNLEAIDLTAELSDQQTLEEGWKYLETSLFKRSGELAKELNKQGASLIQACMDEITANMPIPFRISQDLNLFAKFHNNVEVGYSGMSSGQRRLTNILMMVSLNNLFSKIYNLESGVLGLAVYDEILSFLDDEYIQLAKHFVDQSLSRKLLIVTHDYGLMNMYDSRINVSMGSKGSEYRKSWV